MNKYFALTVAGLSFGIISGLLSNVVVHMDSDVFNGFSTSGYWFDFLVLFGLPGHVITWKIFDPSDSYLGDDSAYWIPITAFNGLAWMLVMLIFLFLIRGASVLFGRSRTNQPN